PEPSRSEGTTSDVVSTLRGEMSFSEPSRSEGTTSDVVSTLRGEISFPEPSRSECTTSDVVSTLREESPSSRALAERVHHYLLPEPSRSECTTIFPEPLRSESTTCRLITPWSALTTKVCSGPLRSVSITPILPHSHPPSLASAHSIGDTWPEYDPYDLHACLFGKDGDVTIKKVTA
ncbi:MAG: hypothetical protein O3B01_21925, partial [Planctomycetota bacterium]|nr:hypothetical protein [Planctomycetota bacterium]